LLCIADYFYIIPQAFTMVETSEKNHEIFTLLLRRRCRRALLLDRHKILLGCMTVSVLGLFP